MRKTILMNVENYLESAVRARSKWVNKFMITTAFVDPSVEIEHIEDPILRIIEQFKNHPSVVAINKKKLNKQSSFEYIPKSDVKKEILNLDVSKASQDSDMPTKIIKVNADKFPEVLYKVFNRL